MRNIYPTRVLLYSRVFIFNQVYDNQLFLNRFLDTLENTPRKLSKVKRAVFTVYSPPTLRRSVIGDHFSCRFEQISYLELSYIWTIHNAPTLELFSDEFRKPRHPPRVQKKKTNITTSSAPIKRKAGGGSNNEFDVNCSREIVTKSFAWPRTPLILFSIRHVLWPVNFWNPK